MNATRQAVHILLKDIRGHVPEIGLVVALNAILALAFTETWTESLTRNRGDTLISDAAQVLLVVAWCALIGRVVQSDGVAGKAASWLTRPHSRPALLASKLAFVLLFVHVPNFLGQLAIVAGSGVPLSLPQLLATQAVIAAGVSLPLMAVAALTTTFSRFVLGGIVAAPFVVYVYGEAPYSSADLLAATGLATIPLIAGAALACQYRWRSTLRVAAWSLVALILLGLGMLPPATLFVLRARAEASSPQSVASTIRLGDASERGDSSYPPPFVSLPIDGQFTANASIRRVEVEVHSSDGREIDLVEAGTGLRFTPENDVRLYLQLSPADYDALIDSRVSVRLVVDILTFETREMEPIPLDGSFAIVDGRAQCGLSNPYQIACRMAFGAFGRSVFQLSVSDTEAQLAWSPIWWGFTLNPIQTRTFGTRSAPMTPISGESIATVLREPANYTRQEVTFENIRLGDWAP